MVCPICAVVHESEAGGMAKHILVGHPVEGALATAFIAIGTAIWPKRWPVIVGVAWEGPLGSRGSSDELRRAHLNKELWSR
jgi:hypothetical protein